MLRLVTLCVLALGGRLVLALFFAPGAVGQAALTQIDLTAYPAARPIAVSASGDFVRLTDGLVWDVTNGLRPAPGPSPAPPPGSLVPYGSDATGLRHFGLLGSRVCTWEDGRPLRVLDDGGVWPLDVVPSGVSADGRVVVGTGRLSSSSSFEHGVLVWREGHGATLLASRNGGRPSVSLDGCVIVGNALDVIGIRFGYRWDWNGLGYDATALAWNQWNIACSVDFVTPDGSAVFGAQEHGAPPQPNSLARLDVWTPSAALPSGVSPSMTSRPAACSADGRRYLGQYYIRNGPKYAMVSSTRVAMLLQSLGVSIPPGVELQDATAISLDGHFVAGTGRDGVGRPIAWLAALVEVGMRSCGPAALNSRTLPSSISALGSASVVANDLTLVASLLPRHAPGVFLCSRTLGPPMPAASSAGHICLAGMVGTFSRPGEPRAAGPGGMMTLWIDLTDMPVGTGAVAAMPGETWHFQAWYRDRVGTAGSNLTDALSVLLH